MKFSEITRRARLPEGEPPANGSGAYRLGDWCGPAKLRRLWAMQAAEADRRRERLQFSQREVRR